MLSKTSTRILFVALLLVVIFLSPCQSQNTGDIKPIDEKVDSLISIMTLKDKITQIQHGARRFTNYTGNSLAPKEQAIIELTKAKSDE